MGGLTFYNKSIDTLYQISVEGGSHLVRGVDRKRASDGARTGPLERDSEGALDESRASEGALDENLASEVALDENRVSEGALVWDGARMPGVWGSGLGAWVTDVSACPVARDTRT